MGLIGDGGDRPMQLSVGGIHTLPGGRRLGIISGTRNEAVLALVGAGDGWSGGLRLRVGQTVCRGGLSMTMVGTRRRLGNPVVLLKVVEQQPFASS